MAQKLEIDGLVVDTRYLEFGVEFGYSEDGETATQVPVASEELARLWAASVEGSKVVMRALWVSGWALADE